MEEIKEIPNHTTYYCTFVKTSSPTGSYWYIGTMCDTKEEAARYGSYYDKYKIFKVELPI